MAHGVPKAPARPGGAHKRNFNLNPRGRMALAPVYRHVHSRSKSRHSSRM